MNDNNPDDERARHLNYLIHLASSRAVSDYDFKRAIGSLLEDLSYIEAALLSDPQTWRLNRSFHTVHVPSLTTIMTMLESIDSMTSISDEERHQINASLNRAAQLATSARQRIEGIELQNAKIELEVLAGYAPKPEVPFEKASFLTRTLDGVASASDSTWAGAKSGAAALPNLVGRLKDGVNSSINRASSIPLLTMNLQKTLSGAVSDSVTKPISMRLQASSKALKHGVGAGVGIGVVVGVLCPPLLPISAGGAVLAAMRAWRKEIDAVSELNEVERERRIVELKAERSEALLRLTSGASALQMETEDLNLTLDVETGEADAVILKGEHSGRTWSSLTVVEKAEVASLLAQGAGALLNILEIGTDSL